MVLHALHLCSGYGGFELALRLAGINARTVAHVERDAYAAATLVARMEEAHLDQAPIWDDLTTFDPEPWAGRVDLITAGFPCQPFSAAGQQRGVDDERWLWPAIGRLISDVGPRLVFLENVPGLVRAGLPHVLSDLAQLGFDAEWGLFSAAEAGAPHKRERFWLLAHTDRERLRGQRVPVGRSLDRTEARRGSADVGHPGGSGRPEDPGGAPCDEAAAIGPHPRRCDHVAHGAGQGLGNTDGWRLEAVTELPRGSGSWVHRDADGPSGTPLADTAGGGRLQDRHDDRRNSTPATCEGPSGDVGGFHPHRQWPPGRDDTHGWDDWIAAGGPEPAVRRSADGRPPELADALHLGGNGLVPAVAAAAFIELARRLDVDLEGL